MKRIICAVLAAALACGLCGCAKNEESSVVSYSDTGFDIERIRRAVVVDGQILEIPIKLKDLPKEWTYEVSANVRVDDRCYVEVKDKNGDLLFSCGAINYNESKAGESKIFDAPFENEKCTVDGITPFKTTKDEVTEKYGEPSNIREYTDKKHAGWEEYRYGSLEGKTSDDWYGKCLMVTFNEKGIVDWVTIVYTD